MSLYWPILLIVVSNVFYHICSKSMPEKIDPFASLTVTYLVGALVSAVLYFVINKNANLFQEYKHMNWTSFVLGISIVGLEVGAIYMYKVGWGISVGQLVHSALLAICLVIIGYFVYHEAITVTKLIGIAVCLVGLFLINK